MTSITDKELHDHAAHDDHHGHHDVADMTIYGFWIYIMSDCLLFGSLFATYAVLSGSYAGQISLSELMSMELLLSQTTLLLVSSFTFGMAMLGAYKKNMGNMMMWLVLTFILGAGFLAMELYEFYHFSHEGATPQTSAYWSAFYGLVATHGLHVFAGLIWMLVLFVHFKRDGFNERNMIRLACLSLFWHFLDIIWICVFSFVYLFQVI